MFDGRIGLDGSGGGFGTIPSVGGPFNRFDEGGASQGVIAFGIGMIYDPPVAVHIVDQCAVPFRPPVVMGAIGMHYRIIGRIFPRSGDTLRTGGNCHVACCRTGRSSLCGSQVIITVMVIQFRRFQTHTFRFPVIGISPAFVHFLFLADGGQSVGRQSDDFSFVDI